MKFTIGSRVSRYTSFLLTIIISLFLVWNSAKSWLAYTYATDPPPDGFRDAIAVEGDNSQFYFLLGQYYDNYDYSAPRDQIYELYRKALELNPFNYNYWFYLAEFLSNERKKSEAIFALNTATELSPGVVSLRWAAGILASELGDKKAIMDNLKAVISYDPHRRQKSFIILWQTIRNEEQILNLVPENALTDYLNYLIDTQRVSEAIGAWNKISNTNEVPNETFLRYVNFLINQHKLPAAKTAWVNRLGNWEGVWNGNFEHDILNGGFDWRIDDTKGVTITRKRDANNNNFMEIDFDGKNNVDFYHFSQIVPVDENSKYRLTTYMKSTDISTENGLLWEVYCFNMKDLYAKTEEVSGTTDWHPIQLSFETPQACNSVVIRLRRFPSEKFDKLITGTLLIDNVVLKKE